LGFGESLGVCFWAAVQSFIVHLSVGCVLMEVSVDGHAPKGASGAEAHEHVVPSYASGGLVLLPGGSGRRHVGLGGLFGAACYGRVSSRTGLLVFATICVGAWLWRVGRFPGWHAVWWGWAG
jgi:hypothetical protein